MAKSQATWSRFWLPVAPLLAVLALLIGNEAGSTQTAWAAPKTTVTFQQGVGGYSGAADTFIMQSSPTVSQGSALWVEWDSDDPSGSGQSNFGLIRFDGIFGAGASQIPAGSTILSATLTYVVSNTGGAGQLSEAAVNWTQTVTYNTFGAEAGVQAGDYGASLGSIDGASTGTKTKDVKSSLAAWSANPSANRGWIIRPSGTDGVEFRSSNYGASGDRPRLTVEYSRPGDRLPNAPTLVKPLNGATSVTLPTELGINVVDPDGDDLNVTFFGRQAGSTEAGQDFTIIAMPDTQHYVDNAGANAAHFMAQTRWLAENAAALNIAFVTGLGDIVENGNTDPEWKIADAAYKQIENAASPTYGIPYGLSVGNHDQQPIGGGSSASTAKYNEYFGVNRFGGRVYYGGHFGSDNDNHFELFRAGGIDFINISFEYDTTPEQAVLDWADALLVSYPNHKAIVSTHHLINLGNPASFGTQGQAIYNALSDRPNLFLMLGGHVHGEGRRQDTGPNGNVIHSLLSDYQDYPNGGNGFLRIMTFSPANKTIQVRTYSPSLNQYETDDSSQFVLNVDLSGAGPYQTLGTVRVPSGSNASVLATSLNKANTRYEWYARVDDGSHVVTSATWSFTSGVAAPTLPASPTFTSTTPASPANDNSPEIRGNAVSGSTVHLYTNNTCTSAVAATGSAAAFSSPGLTVTVGDNTTTTFWATAMDAASAVSACSPTSIGYNEVTPATPAPASPTFTSTSPASPANDNSPEIRGSAASSSTVRLYTNNTCTSAVAATGTAAAFSSPGLTVTVGDNTTTTFWATATTANGTSLCSTSSIAYNEVTPAAPVSSGWRSCTAQAAVTATGHGDGNGFQLSPASACADDGVWAEDRDSGTSTNTGACPNTNTGKDRHDFSGFSFNDVPAGATIRGIEVRLNAWASFAFFSSARVCVQLSTNGGATWTTISKTASLTTSQSATYTLGSGSDLWGRSWTASDLANLRVRLTSVAGESSRDFMLDWLGVQVTYTP